MDYKEQIEKEAKEYAKNTHNGYFINQDGREKGFISGVNSEISERIRIDFAIECLEEIKQESPFNNYVPHQYFENKITELKNKIK